MYSRENSREREQFSCEISQIHQQEDKQRLNDAHPLGETSDEGQDNSKEKSHQRPTDAYDEEGG